MGGGGANVGRQEKCEKRVNEERGGSKDKEMKGKLT